MKIKKKNNFFIEPLEFNKEGTYNLNAVKEIKATKGFLDLNPEERNFCQFEENYINCTSRIHEQKIIDNCKCLPLSLWNTNSSVKH